MSRPGTIAERCEQHFSIQNLALGSPCQAWLVTRPEMCGREAVFQVGSVDVCYRHFDAVRDQIISFIIAERAPVEEHRTAIAEQRAVGGVVYYVERDGFIKIGTTTNIAKRLAGLSRGGDLRPDGATIGPVTLLVTHGGGRVAEQIQHQRFQADRIAGEWFRKSPELLAHIELINTRRGQSAA